MELGGYILFSQLIEWCFFYPEPTYPTSAITTTTNGQTSAHFPIQWTHLLRPTRVHPNPNPLPQHHLHPEIHRLPRILWPTQRKRPIHRPPQIQQHNNKRQPRIKPPNHPRTPKPRPQPNCTWWHNKKPSNQYRAMGRLGKAREKEEEECS